jgi:transcriptional regulator with XRE-family HTH domain
MTNIGERLKDKRIARGWNQRQIADIAGVTNAAVSKWESNGGASISAIVALKLAQKLNVNPFWLIFGQGEANDKVHVPDLSDNAQQLARRIDQLPEHINVAICELLAALRPRSA